MQKTGIDYLTHTWNPFPMRCTRISPGCDNCWHLKMAKRMAGNPILSHSVREAMGGFRDPVHDWDRIKEPEKLRKPARIGVQFMGDIFHEDLPFDWIDNAFDTMAFTPRHTFIVLTKRPERMHEFMQARLKMTPGSVNYAFPLSNVWLGVTAENQKQANKRIPLLVHTPAAVRWVSVEPMLGPVDLGMTWHREGGGPGEGFGLDWVVCGGESGPGARNMDRAWAYSLRDQCKKAGTPFFMKQMSGKEQIPTDLHVRELPDCEA